MRLEGKKWSICTLLRVTGSEASGREGNLGVFLGVTSCLAVEMLFGEALARKSAQYEALGFLMAFKSPSLDCLAVRKASGVWRLWAMRVAIVNSLRGW